MSVTRAQPKRFTIEEFYKMYECGLFQPPERVELVEGEVVLMSPQNLPHALAVSLLNGL